jgi:transcriptional antiterminator RfaH
MGLNTAKPFQNQTKMQTEKTPPHTNWFVIRVKPRYEKKTTERLEKLGITVYCPTTTQIHQWSDRKKKVQVPLFSSYVFVQVEEKERNRVFEAPGVLGYLRWLGQAAIVREEEIELIKKWLVKDVVSSKVEKITSGDRVAIESGPFKGRKGTAKQVGKKKIQILLTELGLKVTLDYHTEIKVI